MFDPFAPKFGTVRGFVRLMLDNIAMYAGLYRKYETVDWSSVRRIVFVCQGNVCRSAYAHWLALRETDAVASLGLSTSTGDPAYDVAVEVARISDVDLTSHRTTASPIGLSTPRTLTVGFMGKMGRPAC